MTDASQPTSPPVVLTRAPEDNATLRRRLEVAGQRVIEWPAIATEPLPLPARDVADALCEADAIVFASRRAARALAMLRSGAPLVPAGVIVAAVGPSTATELARLGLGVDLVGSGGGAADLADPLLDATGEGARIVIVCSAAARDELPATLERGGRLAVRLAVHRPVEPAAQRHPARLVGELGAVVACSPSAARHLLAWNAWLRPHPFVAIGVTTAEALRGLGCNDVSVADAASDDALERAILRVVARAPSRPRDSVPRETQQ